MAFKREREILKSDWVLREGCAVKWTSFVDAVLRYWVGRRFFARLQCSSNCPKPCPSSHIKVHLYASRKSWFEISGIKCPS